MIMDRNLIKEENNLLFFIFLYKDIYYICKKSYNVNIRIRET